MQAQHIGESRWSEIPERSPEELLSQDMSSQICLSPSLAQEDEELYHEDSTRLHPGLVLLELWN